MRLGSVSVAALAPLFPVVVLVVLVVGPGCRGTHPLASADAASSDAKVGAEAAPPDVAGAGEDGGADVPLDVDATIDAGDAATPDRSDASGGDGFAPDGSVSNPEARAAYVASVASFCGEMAVHQCAYQSRCNRAFASEEDCRPVARARCEASLTAWQATGAGEGRVGFDQTKVAACLAELDNPECEFLDQPACAVLTAGRLPDGAACIYADECAGGTCGRTSAACGGTCHSPGKMGAPCSVGGTPNCDPAVAWCDLATHTCQPKKALGELCTPVPESQCPAGASCESTSRNRCGDFAEDNFATCRCRVLGVEGAACVNDVNCLDGLACIAGKCRGLAARGESCDLQYLVPCVGDLACLPKAAPGSEGMGVCGDRLAAGARCWGRECARGTSCEYPEGGDVNSGRCRPLHPIGSPCVYVTDCVPGAFCRPNPGTFTCERLPTLGESCKDAGHCWGGGGVTCISVSTGQVGTPTDQVCGFLPRKGEPCFRQCAEGLYCESSTCVPQKENDDLCTGSAECRSGQCLTVNNPACNMASCRMKRCLPFCSYAKLP